nr:MAG TPA: hypothetical protein [Crassvirales sp.]
MILYGVYQRLTQRLKISLIVKDIYKINKP